RPQLREAGPPGPGAARDAARAAPDGARHHGAGLLPWRGDRVRPGAARVGRHPPAQSRGGGARALPVRRGGGPMTATSAVLASLAGATETGQASLGGNGEEILFWVIA